VSTTKGRRGLKRRSEEDWADEVARVQRIRAAAELAVQGGERSAEWGAAVCASADALVLLLGVSRDGEDEAVSAARARLRRAA
jgi:hypothetical protein